MAIELNVVDNSELVKNAMPEQIHRALEELGLRAEGYAKLNCPVDTGRLRNSITHTAEGYSAIVGTNVQYARFVEFGTVKMKAQPYLKSALLEHEDEYKEVVKRNLST